MTYITSSSATVAIGQKIEIVAVERLINCKAHIVYTSLVQILCSLTQMRRDGEFPRQICAETEYIEEERGSHRYICGAAVSLPNCIFG